MSLQSDYETEKGLENLKNAFVLYLVGSILFFIPIIGGFGEIFYLVALIFFILGWRALGRSSSLKETLNYRSTGKWLLYSIIIAIIVLIVGSILTVIALIASIVSSTTIQVGQFNPLGQSFALRTFLSAIFGVTSAVFVIWLVAWLRMSFSLVKLSDETSQQGLARAGTFYVVQLVILFISNVGLAIALYLGIITFPVANALRGVGNIFGYYDLLKGTSLIFGILGLSGSIIAIIGSYFGYLGVKEALSKITAFSNENPSISPTFPGASSAVLAKTYCPKCGHKIEISDSRFCSNCGAAI